MKKVVFIALACVAALAAFSCTSTAKPAEKPAPAPAAAAPAAPSGPMVEAVRGTPAAIDGTMDPVFAKAQVIETGMIAVGDTSQAHAKGRLAWDDKYLYVFIEVKDAVLCDKSPNPWEQDSVEIYIDEKNSKKGSYPPGVAQYRVSYNNKASGGTGAKLSEFKSGVKIVDGGYNVTVAIPFTLGAPAAGTVIGFDFQTNDDGTGKGVRSGIKDWANKTNNNYQSAQYFGNAKLLP